MKIILGRKGFDSIYGGVASPIFEDGSMLSLPIPDPSNLTYDDLSVPCQSGVTFGMLVDDLTLGKIKHDEKVHLDPDLNPAMYPRKDGWLPLFGPSEKWQSHLEDQKVTVEDLFLFFGWFRRVELQESGKYKFQKGEPDLHVIFGWLQVGEILHPTRNPGAIPEWAKYHPHCDNATDPENNTVYVAKEKLGVNNQFPGGGVFRSYQENLRLTKPEQPKDHAKRSLWQLPEWFYPVSGKPMLSCHSNKDRWSKENRHTILQSLPRGQEFVFDTTDYPEAIGWVESLFK